VTPLPVGILGAAHPHAAAYAACLGRIPGARLVAVADPDPARGAPLAARHGARYVRDDDELLRQPLAAVIVCSENARHAGQVMAAAAAGRHVLCEKPLATDLADARRMLAACRRHGVQLQTAFPVRYHPAVAAARAAVAAGRVGRVLAMRGSNRGRMPGLWFADPALAGGGAVIDHTVHVVDLMRWFTGAEVAEVYAEVDTRFHDLAVDDAAVLSLRFTDGTIASHDPSWSRPAAFPTWGDVALEVVGSEGVLHVEPMAQHLDHYSERAGRLVHAAWGDDWDPLMVQDFVDAVATGRPVAVTGEDGLRALEVAIAAYRSAAGGRPVRLPLPDYAPP
jgi:predicted dehydrogenase